METGAPWRETTLRANGLGFHAVVAGPEDGPLVLLLHGFPECWYGWRHQLGALAAAGYRVVAPDQRGYNRSARPRDVAAYAIDRLAADVVGLIAACGRDRASLVGHDWGGIVAWRAAMRHPSWVARLAVLNAPHPLAYRRFLPRHPGQWLRSWYLAFFQLPRLPEAFLRARHWRGATGALVGTSRPGTFTAADLARYRDAWAQPGALTAMIDWYRAAVRSGGRLPGNARIAAPTLVIWGRRDPFLDPALPRLSLGYCDRARLVMIDEATHWVQHEEAARVNALLLEHLGSPESCVLRPE